jgi:formylglycine-generating enzyme required for sulfatase activity
MSNRLDSAFDFYLTRPTNVLLPAQANFKRDNGLNRSCKVGSYAPNALGLYDMHGNAWEWCLDQFPADPKDPQGASLGVSRGSGWYQDVSHCVAANRYVRARSHHYNDLGLRLARVPFGTPSPAAQTTGRFALAFDGQNSWVKIPSLRINENHALTVEAWAAVEDRVDQRNNFDLLGNSGWLQGFALGIPPAGYGKHGGEKWAFSTRLKSPDTYVQAWEKQPVPQNQLVHVAGIYDKAEIRFYVNGQLQSRTPAGDVKPSALSNMRLGANQEGKDHFHGRMNEVRISKVARYDGDFKPDQRWVPDTDTLALYHFDEGAGSVLKDSSGNDHHGEIVAAKWVQADGTPIGSPPNAVPSKPLPPTYTNSIGMEFVIVPKGKSWLGGGKDKLGDKEAEISADFYVGKYEVTQEEWEKVMGENPSHFSRTGDGKDAVKDITDAELKRFPVENVSWDQSQLFVAKLNKLENETGWVYRLPTELEWEYACRGGPMADKLDSAFDFYFARPTNTLLPEQANIYGKGLKRTCKVGSYEANVLGLYDVYGNVREWCVDTDQAPDASHRVNRGGGWDFGSVDCRTADRRSDPPSWVAANLGLRLARVPAGAPSPEAKTPPLAVAPFTDADVQRIAMLPAKEQVEEVRKELMLRNPGFDGHVQYKIEGDVVTEIQVLTDQVGDIAPVRVFSALRMLKCYAAPLRGGLLGDLTPLKGMNVASLRVLDLTNSKVTDGGMVYFEDCKELRNLHLSGTNVTDVGLAHFKDRKELEAIALAHTGVTDAGLAHFQNCVNLKHLGLDSSQVGDAGLAHFKESRRLGSVQLGHTRVSDAGLAHFKGVRLRKVWIEKTGITDLTPLQDMPLDEVRFTPKNIVKGLGILRDMKSLKTIGIEWNQAWPAAEFWERYDKGEFGLAPFAD